LSRLNDSRLQLAELSLIPVWPHISRPWLISHQWLWSHSDDKSLLRLYIDSWFVAMGLLVISLGGSGRLRWVPFLISGTNVIGFPALFFALLILGR
jgi:hypothetical protein